MRNDLSQSKNAPAALILLVVGVLLAVVMPAVTNFPGWAAGAVGLIVGPVAAALYVMGRGASGEDLLAIRNAVKSAQRGELPARPMNLSADVAEVFTAIEDLV